MSQSKSITHCFISSTRIFHAILELGGNETGCALKNGGNENSFVEMRAYFLVQRLCSWLQSRGFNALLSGWGLKFFVCFF